MIIHIYRILSFKKKVTLIQLYFPKEHYLKETPDKPIINTCKNSHQYFDKEKWMFNMYSEYDTVYKYLICGWIPLAVVVINSHDDIRQLWIRHTCHTQTSQLLSTQLFLKSHCREITQRNRSCCRNAVSNTWRLDEKEKLITFSRADWSLVCV